MSVPTPEGQVRFLLNIQRLLFEGNFVSTYKFALLLALADLSVELGDDSGAALTISIDDIADKFIQFYWRQIVPYVSVGGRHDVLRQNTGRETDIVSLLRTVRQQGTLSDLKRNRVLWNSIVHKVGLTVQSMPLWKLQTIGGEEIAFLYPNTGRGNTIQLGQGVAYNFRRFLGLIENLVQNAWIRHVRRIRFNQDILGQATDLQEFLFGSDRCSLSLFRPLLLDFQSGRCFYCKKLIAAEGDVDHFIPWTLYQIDLAHNFVVAQTISGVRVQFLRNYRTPRSRRNAEIDSDPTYS